MANLCAWKQDIGGFEDASLSVWLGSLWGRRLGPGPYDGSKPLLSLPALSCSPAAFSVGNSSWEKGCSRFETLEPECYKESSELNTASQLWETRVGQKPVFQWGKALMQKTWLSTSQAGQMTHHLARLPFHLAGPIVLVHLCLCSKT